MMTDDDLTEHLRRLAAKPGHETVRVLLHRILTDRLGAHAPDIRLEERVPEVRGRIDALVGRTVIEIKSDLVRELADAEEQLARYLPEKRRQTGEAYVGLATDGALFRAYEMHGDALVLIGERKNKLADAAGTAVWLESVLATRERLPADATAIVANLGRDSTAFARASWMLHRAWEAVGDEPEPRLKWQLWERHLALVYGTDKTSEGLWLRHTYLVCVAKAIAAAAMGIAADDPADLLSGPPFEAAGIHGAVESDFFDWILHAPEGAAVVERIIRHAGRFDLTRIDVDLLKVLYESLIDPENRHDLGEYYTPDWLADRVTRAALDGDTDQRALDPSCGSGTFLFHAIRHKRRAMREAGGAIGARSPGAARRPSTGSTCTPWRSSSPASRCSSRSAKIWASGKERSPSPCSSATRCSGTCARTRATSWSTCLRTRPARRAPRCCASRWRSAPRGPCSTRSWPRCTAPATRGEKATRFAPRLARLGVPEAAREELAKTYGIFHKLRLAGRDHVWGYVARNLSRPIALSADPGMDVILGNPPWLSYRYMSKELKARFRDGSKALRTWVAEDEGHLVTQTDLSGYFFARSTELYLRRGGRIAMVLPLAAMTRGQFQAFRTGRWTQTRVHFTDAWVLDNEDVEPLFRVPTCVLFAERVGAADEVPGLPATVTAFSGRPPRKDASLDEVRGRVREASARAPSVVSFQATSPYNSRFQNGATLFPRLFCYVERAPVGRLGLNRAAPVVRGIQSMHAPWKELTPPEGPVEARFLRTAYLGSSIAPFRILEEPEAVVPTIDAVEEGAARGLVLDSARAEVRGHRYLSDWLKVCERVWDEKGRKNLTFRERLDYSRGLSAQLPIKPLRIVFAKSGTLPAACVLRDTEAVVEHSLLWAACETEDEAAYLAAILNAETVRARVEHMQSRGEQGARHFDKLFFTLPIPLFDAADPLHAEIAAAAHEAERAAAKVFIEEGTAFTTARGAIRAALREDGVSGRIDGLVSRLLGDAGLEDRPRPLSAPAA